MTDREKRLNEARRTLESVNATHASLLRTLEKAERTATTAFEQGTVTGECIADSARSLYVKTFLSADKCERMQQRLAALITSLEAPQ